MQTYDILTRNNISVDRNAETLSCVRLKWHRNHRMRSGLEPGNEYDLVSVETITVVVYAKKD